MPKEQTDCCSLTVNQSTKNERNEKTATKLYFVVMAKQWTALPLAPEIMLQNLWNRARSALNLKLWESAAVGEMSTFHVRKYNLLLSVVALSYCWLAGFLLSKHTCVRTSMSLQAHNPSFFNGKGNSSIRWRAALGRWLLSSLLNLLFKFGILFSHRPSLSLTFVWRCAYACAALLRSKQQFANYAALCCCQNHQELCTLLLFVKVSVLFNSLFCFFYGLFTFDSHPFSQHRVVSSEVVVSCAGIVGYGAYGSPNGNAVAFIICTSMFFNLWLCS